MNDVISKIRSETLKALSQFQLSPLSHFQPMATASLASKIDHTNLKPETTPHDIDKLCDEAMEHGFFGVCVNSSYLPQVASRLSGSAVKPISVVGFPLGACSTETKVFETLECLDQGAQEIDMVLHIGKLKSGLLSEVYEDIFAVVEKTQNIPVKVILETHLLSTEEKICAAILCQQAGASFVKTSTGFGGGGATVEDVKLLKQVVGPNMGVKASGGIRDNMSAKQMIDAGADRIGTSSGVLIIKEQDGQKNSK